MPTQHQEMREKIIDTALSEWGQTRFNKTSLSALAGRLGITKPALYRYFCSKEELIESVETRVVDAYLQLGRTFLEKSKGASLRETLRSYIDIHFRFFGEHPDYFYFFILNSLRKPFLESRGLQPLYEEKCRVFDQLLGSSRSGWSREEIGKLIRFIYTTGIYLLHHILQTEGETGDVLHHISAARSLSPQQRDELVDATCQVCLEGFAGTNFNDEIPFEELEEHCRVLPDEMPEKNRIFEAISELVAEYGLAEASLDKIAKKACLSKSSLYFYFKNKDDMLGSMFKQERTRLIEIILERMEGYASFEEKLYCRILVSGSYLANRMSLMTTAMWFHFQGIQVLFQLPLRDMLAAQIIIVDRALKEKKLRSRPFDDALQMLTYNSILVINEVLAAHHFQPQKPFALKDLRSVYRFFTRGISRSSTQ